MARPTKLTTEAQQLIAPADAEERILLETILKAAEKGDADALAWLNGEGRIVVSEDATSRFVRWDDLDPRGGQKAAEWRTAVFRRDGYRCSECGRRGKLQAHHIKPWAKHPELRFNVSNGITLCPACHAKKHPGLENLIRNARYVNKRGD